MLSENTEEEIVVQHKPLVETAEVERSHPLKGVKKSEKTKLKMKEAIAVRKSRAEENAALASRVKELIAEAESLKTKLDITTAERDTFKSQFSALKDEHVGFLRSIASQKSKPVSDAHNPSAGFRW